MRRLFMTLSLSAIILLSVFVLASCRGKECQHVYDEGVVIRAADCEKGGIIKYTCTVCTHEKVSVTYALPHSYSDVWCSDGDRHWHSALCEHLDAITDNAPHRFVDGECETCGIPQVSQGLEYEINNDGKTYTVIGLGRFEGSKATVARYYKNCEIVAVGESAFANNNVLEAMYLQQYIVHISDRAFLGCEQLTTVQFASSVTYLGDEVFDGCTSLSTIRFVGLMSEWEALPKGENWDRNTGDYIVVCNDGNIEKR